jgi:hypothetical protein
VSCGSKFADTPADDIIEMQDPSTGEKYFFNTITEQSGWTREEAADVGVVESDVGSVPNESEWSDGGDEWFYINAEGYQGPVTSEGLIALHRDKLITKATYVWTEGAADWLPYAYSGAAMEDVEVAFVDEAAKSGGPDIQPEMGKIWAKFFQNALNRKVNSDSPAKGVSVKATEPEPVAYRDQTASAIFEAVKLSDVGLLQKMLTAHEQSWPESAAANGTGETETSIVLNEFRNGPNGQTALHMACEAGRLELVRVGMYCLMCTDHFCLN